MPNLGATLFGSDCYDGVSAVQSITEYYKVLQSITEYYRVFLAHPLGPIFGLVLMKTPVNLAVCSGRK